MARRLVTAAVALVFLASAPSAARAQFGGPAGQPGAPEGHPGWMPGAPFPPQFAPGPRTPEMARRVDAIRVLQKIVQMRLGKKEISAALPSLRALLAAERTAQAQAVEALEQEKRALLAAESPEDMPEPPADKLRQQAQKLRAEQMKCWGELARNLGQPRAAQLQQLVDPHRFAPQWPAGPGSPGVGNPFGFGAPGMPPGMAQPPGQRPNGAMPMLSPAALMDAPTISLEDLVGLLEQRLAALK